VTRPVIAHRMEKLIEMVDWSKIRAEFEVMPGVTYLNTGTCGRTPRPVLRSAEAWRQQLAAEPCEVLWRRLAESLWPARERLAQFVGAPPATLIFMANVTAGINSITSGLRLAPGRHILVTDQEYGAMVFAWERAARRANTTIRTVALPTGITFSRDDVIQRFDDAIDRQTQLIFLSHISTVTGLVLPIEEICAIARDRGVISVIDGAHAPGMISLDLGRVNCDFYSANGHKWLLAPAGSGFLYVRPGLEERIEPLVVSWGWKYDQAEANKRDQEGSTPFIRSHEFQGTRDPAPWLAMPAAIDFHESIGAPQIQTRDRELACYCRAQLSRLRGMEATTPDSAQLSAALVSYKLPSCESSVLQRALWDEYKIETPVLQRPEGPCIRVSTHFYNTHEEIDRLRAALSELLA
jgi:isopenicillin-N epimerase